jgi:hypothetical protein
MIALLNGAEFHGHSFSGRQAIPLIVQGLNLLFQANALPH